MLLRNIGILYQKSIKTPHINRLFYPFSALNFETIAKAMLEKFALIKKKIIQFIYTTFQNLFGIKSFATTLVLVSDEKYISKEIEKSQKLIDSISLKIKKELKIKNKKPSQNN